MFAGYFRTFCRSFSQCSFFTCSRRCVARRPPLCAQDVPHLQGGRRDAGTADGGGPERRAARRHPTVPVPAPRASSRARRRLLFTSECKGWVVCQWVFFCDSLETWAVLGDPGDLKRSLKRRHVVGGSKNYLPFRPNTVCRWHPPCQ